jgi:hypothetical protein
MRYFLLMVVVVFVSVVGYGQGKACSFPRQSISRPDSTKTQQLVKTIAALDLKTYYEADKIPEFIRKAFICWNEKWTIVNPEPEPAPITTRNVAPEDTALARAVIFNGRDPFNNLERQLMYMGLNEHYMLIAYIGDNVCWQYCPIMLFRFENKKIISVMYWRGTSEEVKTKEDVIKSLRCLKPIFHLSL